MARSREEFLEDWRSAQPPQRACDHNGCQGDGLFRAPRSRDRLGALDDYYWFCLDHVRAYNASWNYYAGMNETEIERETRHDSVWQRPTWPLGQRVAGRLWHDPLHLYDDPHDPVTAARARPARALTEEDKALLVFELEPPFELAELKTRYKLLVKRHHPDANGGDKAAEERLKIITRAYALLKTRFFS